MVKSKVVENFWSSQMTWQNHHLIILLLLCPVSNICVCMSCTICHNMCASLQFWIWHNVTMSKSQTSMWIIADHQLGSNWLWFLYPVPSVCCLAQLLSRFSLVRFGINILIKEKPFALLLLGSSCWSHAEFTCDFCKQRLKSKCMYLKSSSGSGNRV